MDSQGEIRRACQIYPGKREKKSVLGRESNKSKKKVKRASEAHWGCTVDTAGADLARWEERNDCSRGRQGWFRYGLAGIRKPWPLHRIQPYPVTSIYSRMNTCFYTTAVELHPDNKDPGPQSQTYLLSVPYRNSLSLWRNPDFMRGLGFQQGRGRTNLHFRPAFVVVAMESVDREREGLGAGRPAVSYFARVYRPRAKSTMSQLSLYLSLHENIICGSSVSPMEWISEWIGKRGWEKPIFWHWKPY